MVMETKFVRSDVVAAVDPASAVRREMMRSKVRTMTRVMLKTRMVVNIQIMQSAEHPFFGFAGTVQITKLARRRIHIINAAIHIIDLHLIYRQGATDCFARSNTLRMR